MRLSHELSQQPLEEAAELVFAPFRDPVHNSRLFLVTPPPGVPRFSHLEDRGCH